MRNNFFSGARSPFFCFAHHNQSGIPVFFLADAPARYNAWDEFVCIVFIDFWLREVMNLVPLFLLLRIRRRRIMHGMNLFLIDL